MARKKQKNKKKKKIEEIDRFSTPEEFFFGFLVAVSLVFSLLCVRSVEQIPTSSPKITQSGGQKQFAKSLRKLTKGYPIEKMSPHIAPKKRKVAAFLVAIAKKESNWGVYSPKKDGRECYNYWGYRGPENPTASGYSCFSSPEQAVNIVGKRINRLVAQNVDTPREMVLWKCGSACSAGGHQGEAKWVRDVAFYYDKVL